MPPTSKVYPSQMLDRIIVRLPEGMRDKLAFVAKKNKRSVNAEMVALIGALIEDDARGQSSFGRFVARQAKLQEKEEASLHVRLDKLATEVALLRAEVAPLTDKSPRKKS